MASVRVSTLEIRENDCRLSSASSRNGWHLMWAARKYAATSRAIASCAIDPASAEGLSMGGA